jgi:hypothetical protein
MRAVVALLVTSLGFAVGGPSLARAGTLDHLVCYRTLDPLQIQASADLLAEIQPEFTATGCLLRKAAEFCVPATKTNVNPPPPFPGASGQTLQNDYVCYTAKCVTPGTPANKLVTDQFGSRVERKYRVSKICVPARKAPAPCGPTGTRQCGGACPNANQQCSPDPADRGCTCLPVEEGCFVTSAGACAGTCPGAGQACSFDDTGHCSCPCSILIPNLQTDVCQMGTCPSPKTCVKNTTDTACVCCALGGVSCSVASDCCVPFNCVGGVCS